MAESNALNDFISQVKRSGLANNNKFQILVGMPACVTSTQETVRLVQLFCDQAQLPDQTISTAQTRTYGEIREMPYENLYGNVSFSFYVDSDFKTKFFFDDWFQSMSNTETRHWEYYDNFIAPQIEITVLNNNGAPVYRATLFECYPKQISAISLDYSGKDVTKCVVSMNYKYWRSERLEATSANSRQSANLTTMQGMPYQMGSLPNISSILTGVDARLNWQDSYYATNAVNVVQGSGEVNIPNYNGVVDIQNTANNSMNGIQNTINNSVDRAKNARDAVNKLLSALPVSGKIQDIRGKVGGVTEQINRIGELGSKIRGFF